MVRYETQMIEWRLDSVDKGRANVAELESMLHARRAQSSELRVVDILRMQLCKKGLISRVDVKRDAQERVGPRERCECQAHSD